MGARQSDRVWLAGGGAVAVLLLVFTWFFLVSPQHDQAGTLHAQTAAVQDKVTELRRRLTQLRQQNAKLSVYKQQLTTLQAALPSQPGLSAFLRQVQSAGDTAAVTVTNVDVGLPTAITGDNQAYALQVAVSADGLEPALELLLDQLQRVQPRAVLVSSVATAASTRAGVKAGTMTMTATMQVFVGQLAGE
ncbi:MAG TPA: hypothetical protein VJT31_32335 [Rugosimonospora sp.]|nr:hypothetical protein [Rugosimonospora sp.]